MVSLSPPTNGNKLDNKAAALLWNCLGWYLGVVIHHLAACLQLNCLNYVRSIPDQAKICCSKAGSCLPLEYQWCALL